MLVEKLDIWADFPALRYKFRDGLKNPVVLRVQHWVVSQLHGTKNIADDRGSRVFKVLCHPNGRSATLEELCRQRIMEDAVYERLMISRQHDQVNLLTVVEVLNQVPVSAGSARLCEGNGLQCVGTGKPICSDVSIRKKPRSEYT